LNFIRDILPLKDRLYRLALRITINHQEAEDIVQDTLIKVWNRRDSLDKIESIEAFAMTICRNLSLDHIKRRERMNLSLDAIPLERPGNMTDPLQKLTQKDNLEHIKKLMNAMPEKQRTCMQLRDFEGKSYKEIADILDITEEQVKINIFRARKRIKEKFPRK
jgi:RNA polymerase sigma factor (sigma-70 family)